MELYVTWYHMFMVLLTIYWLTLTVLSWELTRSSIDNFEGLSRRDRILLLVVCLLIGPIVAPIVAIGKGFIPLIYQTFKSTDPYVRICNVEWM